MNRILAIIAGISSLAFGLRIILSPKFYSWKDYHYFDFTTVKWPFGIILIGIGILLIWSGLRKKPQQADEKLLICPKCERPFKRKDSANLPCPDCGVDMEDANGFYDRHPELKRSDNTQTAHKR